MVQKKQKQIDTPRKNSNPSELSELESSDSSESVQFTQVATSCSGPIPLTLLEFSRFALRNI